MLLIMQTSVFHQVMKACYFLNESVAVGLRSFYDNLSQEALKNCSRKPFQIIKVYVLRMILRNMLMLLIMLC